VVHELRDLVRQRIFGLACGYADTNDCARTAEDPVHRMLLDRDPIDGSALASKPTLCRLENERTRTELYRMGCALADAVLEFHRRRLRRRKVRRITIDLALTDDPTHGQQQLALFNGHFGTWCYLPLLGFLTFDDEPEQYLVAALLRPGHTQATRESKAVLRRIFERVRHAFPRAKIRVRLDGGFHHPDLLRFLDEEEVAYAVAIPANPVLEDRARPLLDLARRISERSGRSSSQFGELSYAARSWKQKERRVIFKAEVVRLEGQDLRGNPRFVVTNFTVRPESVYDFYRGRGEPENRIKELQHDLEIDRTSCHRFWANQLRVLLTAAAYVLFQAMRSRMPASRTGRPQVGMLRLRLLKIGGRIERSVRRVVLHLSSHHPWQGEWRKVALAWGGSSP